MWSSSEPSPSGVACELVQILREQLRVIGVDLRHLLDQLGNVVVVRERMMRFRHADLRIGPWALLLAEHERNDARQIGLEREHLQIHHQRQVIFEHRRRAQRLRQRGQFDVALPLRHLNAALDVANGVGVFVHLALIVRARVPA